MTILLAERSNNRRLAKKVQTMTKEPLKILLLAGGAENDTLPGLGQLQKEGFDPVYERVDNPADMTRALDNHQWDIILSDYALPGFTAPDALKLLQDKGLDLPFIVISGTVSETAAIEAMRAGAHDYFTKNNLERLGQAVRRELDAARSRREGRQYVEETEQRRKESEARFQTIMESSPDAIFITDQNGVYTYVNPAATQLLGYTRGELIGRNITYISVPEQVEEHRRIFQQLLTKKRLYTEIEIVGKDGRPIPVDLNAVLLPNGEVYGSCRDLTEHKNAEEERWRNQAMLSRTEAIANIGSWEWDLTTNAVTWSEGMFRITDRPEFQPVLTFDDHVKTYHPDDLHQLGKAVVETLTSGRPYSVELRVILKDGTTKICLSRGQPKMGPDKQPMKLYGSLQDITRQKQIEEEREKAYNQTEALLNAARAVLSAKTFTTAARMIFDIGAETIGVLGGYFALLSKDGKHNELQFLESGGQPCSVDPDLPMPVRGLRARAYQEKRAVYDNDFRASAYQKWMPEGHLELENVLFAPIILEGEAVGLFGYANKPGGFNNMDVGLIDSLAEIAAVSLREDRIRKALEQSEEAYRLLFDSSADALLTLEPPAWKIASWNPAALHLFGVQDATEFAGRPPWAFSPPAQPDGQSSADKAREIVETTIREGHQFFDWQHRRPDGSEFPSTVMLTRIDLKEKTVVQASIRDMTEHKKIQHQIAQTDRLSSMGMLAAGVAHEINNPLAYVLYNLESLTEELPDLVEAMREVQALLWRLADETPGPVAKPEINQNLLRRLNPVMLQDALDRFREALSGSHRIRDIARGLSTFSRVEKDQLVSVDIMHVIEVAINMAYNEIKYRARLVKDYGKTPPVIASDGRLSQVFLNLLINATHAIEEGRVKENEIRITTWSDGENVYAEVRDTGKGIAPENLDKLFEPFFTTKQVGIGSGLGLPISKNIVESYGGSIAVQSESGRGTGITIRLPVTQQKTQAAEKESDMDTDANAQNRGRILIVDDEKGIRGAMVRMLREYETIQAANGREAQEILQKDQAFDLVLCDMMMPDFSGMDLHQWMTEACPVLAEQLIFISGGVFTPRAKEYLNAVNNLRLEKPFDKTTFQKIVKEHIQSVKTPGNS